MDSSAPIQDEQSSEEYREKLLARFNGEQAEAVASDYVSVLVLAGAGSGKTSALTGRIAYLTNDGLAPWSIMAVTFTNKSSKEMSNRLKKAIAREDVSKMWIGTFHSLCNRMLRENHDAAGLPANFGILDADGQEAVVKPLMIDAGLIVKRAKGDPLEDKQTSREKMTPGKVVKFINRNKEFGIAPDEVEVVGENDENMIEMYRQYNKACAAQGLLDFSDLLYRTVEMLEKNAELRGKYRDRFKAILVDEFQDTNDIQYRWLMQIKGEKAFVMAVGDDDQSIYAFRGAKPSNMQKFMREVTATPERPAGYVIKLEQNYRSLPFILDSANAVIGKNTQRLGKDLWTSAPDNGEKIQCTEFADGRFEAERIASDIHRSIRDKKVSASEVAVLYRTNTQSRNIEQELNKLGVPVIVYGGQKFYARAEVKNVLAYLDLTCFLDRDISFARVVNFPKRGIGERTVEDLRQEAKTLDKSMMEMIAYKTDNPADFGGSGTLRTHQILSQFSDLIMSFAEEAANCTLSQLIETIVVQSGMKKHYQEEDAAEAEERLNNIGELVSAARQFEIENPDLTTAAQQLPDYLNFVALMTSTSEADMDKKNAVSLMTVHSAKGLEFDHVYIAGLEEGMFPHARSLEGSGGSSNNFEDLWKNQDPEKTFENEEDFVEEPKLLDSDELKEERRLMYVAITRARKQLHISYANRRMVNGQDKEFEVSRFIAEIPSARMKFTKDVAAGFQFGARSGGNANNSSGGSSEKPRRDWTPKRQPAMPSVGGLHEDITLPGVAPPPTAAAGTSTRRKLF
jgi:DNA helicase-2/ATP-dependent DNA helicase PcrA